MELVYVIAIGSSPAHLIRSAARTAPQCADKANTIGSNRPQRMLGQRCRAASPICHRPFYSNDMLDPKFTAEILETWRRDQDHPHRGRAKRPVPSAAIVSTLLDECFRATLRDEEGQPIEFSVALLTEEDIGGMAGPANHQALQFELQREFSAPALAKIAPAFDPELTTIVVSWNAEARRLEFWGTWLHAPTHNRFTEVPFAVVGSASFRPDLLTIISKGRAALYIARGGSQIGVFQGGYFVQATPTPFTSHSLGQHVHEAILRDSTLGEEGTTYWHFARDALEQVLSEASLRGHGGTVILLPPNVPISESMFASKFKLTGSFGLRQTLRNCMRASKARNMLGSIAQRKVANETIQRISQLAAVDGALILTFEFDVLAFGATLTAPRTHASAVIGPNGFGSGAGQLFDINRYGTRHRSAMDFAAAVDGSIAFVISQDGPIRAFRRASDAVVNVWPDCSTSMFV